MKVFDMGRCVEFSPDVINKFLGRSEEPEAEVEFSDSAIGLSNFIYTVGTKTKWDFDSYIFQTTKHAKPLDVKMPTTFPMCFVVLFLISILVF